MKPSFWATVLLLTLIANLTQDKTNNVCRLETKYDRLTDTTIVHCDLVEMRDVPAKLTIQAVASYRGTEPNETAKFWLQFSGFITDASRNTQPVFQEATIVTLSLSDTTRLEVPVSDYHNDFFELNHLLAESARAEIIREDLRKLLDAKSLKCKWNVAEVKFSDAALSSLKSFISRQVLYAEIR